MVGDVEEVRRRQVAGEVLVLGDDRGGLDAAVEAESAVRVRREGRVVVLELAAVGRDDHVLDRESHGRMDLVDGPASGGRNGGGSDGGHGVLLVWRWRGV